VISAWINEKRKSNMIDYSILANSVEYYESHGYQRIESPWTVTKEISKVTSPPNASFFTIEEKKKVLVASGEQSLLYLYNKGFLPKGKWQTITPCFRDETFDSLHTKYFLKNELMITDSVNEATLISTIDDALNFFRQWAPESKVKETGPKSYDIVYDDIELGSYGMRYCPFVKWVYGTGVAEPRFSRVLDMYGISHKKN